MIICNSSEIFLSNSCDCANLIVSLIGFVAVSFLIYTASRTHLDVDTISKSNEKAINLYRTFSVGCSVLTVGTFACTLVFVPSVLNHLSFYLTFLIRLYGWMVTFRFAHVAIIRGGARLLGCSAIWSLTQVVGSGLSANSSEDSGNALVAILGICYSLFGLITLIIVLIFLFR